MGSAARPSAWLFIRRSLYQIGGRTSAAKRRAGRARKDVEEAPTYTAELARIAENSGEPRPALSALIAVFRHPSGNEGDRLDVPDRNAVLHRRLVLPAAR